MFVYSNKIIKFINGIKISLKEILSKEMGLKVFGDRFYDKPHKYSYPIKVVIFNNRRMLGYFDPNFYEMGFHECLMHTTKEQLQDIIRHELAHYMTFIKYGDAVDSHGSEFRDFCRQMRWSPEVQKATTCLDDGAYLLAEEENHILRKVQKLMALATSSNTHEAEQAMIKSQQLLLKHNLNFKHHDEEEKIFLKRILKQKKESAKLRAIAQILETFFVNTVYNKQDGFVHLEIVGNATNVEIAEYVAHMLQPKMEDLWDQAKLQLPSLKGTIAKNSFFIGVAQGYCKKINFLKKEYDHNTSHALILIEKKLKEAKAMVYQRLSKGSSRANYCRHSSELGEQAGKSLNIHTAVSSSTKNAEFYITQQS